MAFVWTFSYWETLWRRIGFEFPVIINVILLLVLALASHDSWKYQVRIKDVFYYLCVVFVFYISTLFYPESTNLADENAFRFLVCTVPFYFIGLMFNFAEYKQWVVRFAYFAVIVNVVFMLIVGNISGGNTEETMRRAYILLPSLLVLAWRFIERRRFVDFSFFVVCFMLISGYGSRGPYVCLLFFLVVYLIFFYKWKKPLVSRSIIIAFACALYAFIDYFANMMKSVVSSMGLSSRIFESILNGAFLNYEESNGRDSIQSALISRLNSNHGNGFGLYTDRAIGEGYYAHNFFVEIWYNFGYLIGSAISISFLILVFHAIRKSEDGDMKIILLLMFSAYFVQLMFSSSYLQSSGFFLLIGLCVQFIRKTNNCVTQVSKENS